MIAHFHRNKTAHLYSANESTFFRLQNIFFCIFAFFSHQFFLSKKGILHADQWSIHCCVSIVNHKLTFVISTINDIFMVFIPRC